MYKKAPWTDFVNNDLFEGDTIQHPDKTEGVIVYMNKYTDPHDQWRVDYGNGNLPRLFLQIGDKGQAIKAI